MRRVRDDDGMMMATMMTMMMMQSPVNARRAYSARDGNDGTVADVGDDGCRVDGREARTMARRQVMMMMALGAGARMVMVQTVRRARRCR